MRQSIRQMILALVLMIPTGMCATNIKGDANNDQQVSVTDVTTVINYILFSDTTSLNFNNADFNSDGEVNVTDVVAIVNYILHLNEDDNDINISIDGDDSGINYGGDGDGSDQTANGTTFTEEENQ